MQICLTSCINFLKGHPRPLFHLFSVFSKKHYNFHNKYVRKKCPSSIRCRDSNSQPSYYESPPLTSRPKLAPCYFTLFLYSRKTSFVIYDPSGLALLFDMQIDQACIIGSLSMKEENIHRMVESSRRQRGFLSLKKISSYKSTFQIYLSLNLSWIIFPIVDDSNPVKDQRTLN